MNHADDNLNVPEEILLEQTVVPIDPERKLLEDRVGQVWTTKEMQEEFTVESFCYGICLVERKSDGQKGSLDFQHMPRFYHSFREG